jgi:hypothetical protein
MNPKQPESIKSPFLFTAGRYKQPCYFPCDTLAEAIEEAMLSLAGDECWPQEISKGKEVLWTQSGPADTRDSLKQFAEKHGVKWEGDQ